MTKRDRDLWINDCRWEVRNADAARRRAQARLAAACDEIRSASTEVCLAEEADAHAREQLATAESGRGKRKP